jgi:hypothetical protein
MTLPQGFTITESFLTRQSSHCLRCDPYHLDYLYGPRAVSTAFTCSTGACIGDDLNLFALITKLLTALLRVLQGLQVLQTECNCRVLQRRWPVKRCGFLFETLLHGSQCNQSMCLTLPGGRMGSRLSG